MNAEILHRAATGIIRQFRYYLVTQDAPQVARRFREAVIESVEQIKLQSGAGSPFRGPIPGFRSWPVRGFDAIRIYYGSGRDTCYRILHGKRNLRRILRQEKLSY